MNTILLWTLPLLGANPADPGVISVPQIAAVSTIAANSPQISVIDEESLPGRPIEPDCYVNRPADAFDVVASPKRITEGNESIPNDSASATGADCAYVVFDSAANIAVPGYDRFGGRFDQEGAVLYEGMAIRIRGDGNYTVRYVIETPATEVTLRMQFVVLRPSCDPSLLGTYEQIGTITLPPINFRPDANALTNGRPLQWKVEQHGYSRHLKTCKDNGLRLDRTATALFGSASK